MVTMTTDENTVNRDEENHILNFMTADEAIELYRKIAKDGLPELDWQFYGRRKESGIEEGNTDMQEPQNVETDTDLPKEQQEDQFNKDTFDFDESFPELQAETSTNNESLQLQKRVELGSERKTNLSDIMNVIFRVDGTDEKTESNEPK